MGELRGWAEVRAVTERHVETCEVAEGGIRRALEELRECRDTVERVTDASAASEAFRGTLREAVDLAEELAATLAAGADVLRRYLRAPATTGAEGDAVPVEWDDPGEAPAFDPALAGRLPPYGTRGEKTTGIIDLGGGRVVEQISGYDGPTRSMPRPRPGMDRNLLSHVEAHAVALMRRHGVTHATLYVNQEPCEYIGPRGRPWGCSRALPRMLYAGETLTVHGPGGYRRTFAGRTPRPEAAQEQDDG